MRLKQNQTKQKQNKQTKKKPQQQQQQFHPSEEFKKIAAFVGEKKYLTPTSMPPQKQMVRPLHWDTAYVLPRILLMFI